MTLHSFSIDKDVSFRGGKERYSNVYTYDTGTGVLLAGQAETILDQLVAAERLVHAPAVTFKQGRAWGPLGDPATSETILLKDYSGPGTFPSSGLIYRESCVVVAWECARNSATGKKVYLRKYLRCAALDSGDQLEMTGQAPLGEGTIAAFKTYADKVDVLRNSGGFEINLLRSPSGNPIRDENNGRVLPYLHSRQFRFNGKRPARTATGAPV
jgi:hypothetical protein